MLFGLPTNHWFYWVLWKVLYRHSHRRFFYPDERRQSFLTFHCRRALNLQIDRDLRLFHLYIRRLFLRKLRTYGSTMQARCKLHTCWISFFHYFLFSRAQQLKISVNYAVIRITAVIDPIHKLDPGFLRSPGQQKADSVSYTHLTLPTIYSV